VSRALSDVRGRPEHESLRLQSVLIHVP